MGKVYEVVERSSGFWVVDGKGTAEGPYSRTQAGYTARTLERKTERGRLIEALRNCVMAADTYAAFVTTGTPVTAAALKDFAKAQTEARVLLAGLSG